MRESKSLKIISYLLIPVLVAVMGLSLFSNYMENYETMYTNEKEYFQTDGFVSRYMGFLSNMVYQLIYENESLPTCYDGETQICYIENGYYNDLEIQDCYVLVQYENKAITNIELTSDTNTIDKLLNYIAQNENSKKVNILAGNIESDSDIVANKGIKYFDFFEKTYYTLERQDETPYVMSESEATEYLEETYETSIVEQQKRQYKTTNVQDFMVYSSYKEELRRNISQIELRERLEDYRDLGENVYVVVPACLAILLVIGIYLIVSVGHSKGKEGIDLNDVDKIPYEILLLIALIGAGILTGLAEVFANLEDNIDLAISLFVTIYIVGYFICAVGFDTTIKRMKARTLIKNTLCYKAWRWFVNIVKKAISKMREIWNKSTESMNIVKKLVLLIIGYIVVASILLGIFNVFGLFLDFGLVVYIFYKLVERINGCTKIEKHLKEMYEGNKTAKLNSADFTNEFQNVVKYINDISNGFENAIQEGIKSERLKTELITNVSHDIKTPLTSIINYVDLLKKEEIENEKAKEYIGVLENKSQRLKKLTEDLIEASKASSGNVKLKIETINVAELIKQSTGEFEDKFKAKSLEIITNIPDEEICINADNRYMYRIIENIFSNVAKYSMENSRVYIDVVRKYKKVYIDVKNISKDVLNISEEELMQRFVRGDKSRTTEGSGLGISISKSLAELQKGNFEIKIDGDLFKVELTFDTIEK